MIPKTYLLVVFLFASVLCCAQDTLTLGLFPQQVIMKPVSFSEITVIDLRSDTNTIGHCYQGAPRKEHILRTPAPLAAALSGFGQKMIARTNKRQPQKLAIVVYEFYYGHKAYEQILPALYLAADFYLSNSKEGYRLYRSLDLFREYVTPAHPDRDIEAELNNIFSSIAFDTVCRTTGPELQLAQLATDRSSQKNGIPVYHSEPAKGIYMTFEAFKNNTPSVTDFKQKNHFNEDGNEPEFFAATTGGGKQLIDPKKAYAAYNGKNWYKATGNKFVGMRFEDGEYYCRYVMHGLTRPEFIGLSDWLIYESGNENDYVNDSPKGKVLYDCRIDYRTGRLCPVKRMKQL